MLHSVLPCVKIKILLLLLKFRARKMSEGELMLSSFEIKNDNLISGSKQRMSAVITKSSDN